jgi:hypothetical protein
MHAGNQVPYLLEQPDLARSLALTAVSDPDPKRPGVSRWRVTLPQAGLPLRSLILTSDTSLFARDFRIFEWVTGSDGRDYASLLGTGAWRRTPEPGSPASRTFLLSARPQSATLFIETDNGDNPAIALTQTSVTYAVARLVFKVQEAEDFVLFSGNPEASAPRYDLGLVAGRLLTAPRLAAHLGAPETHSRDGLQAALAGMKGGAVFWTALGLVVIVLLVVIAKLLPKTPE